MPPKISVITPTNSLRWFRQARESLLNQTLKEWEWIVIFNGGVFEASNDARIKCVPSIIGSQNIGALKREACMNATADFILEFDHDDELDRSCLAEVVAAFEATGAYFVYSDGAHVYSSGKPQIYSKEHGWEYYRAPFHGRREETLIAARRPLLLPQNVSRIWYAPDHVRAWRRDAYWAAGGHDPELAVCDDQELMGQLFLRGPFHHIPKCLYKYVIHGANGWLQKNALIQELTVKLHDRTIHNLALAHWRKTHLCIDLGGGVDKPDGWKSCDTHDADFPADLNGPWPFADNAVGVFRAHDVIEHLKDPIHTMNEAWRCLAHGGLLLIEVPSSDGRGAFQDPTHVSFWNANSAWYYCKAAQQKYIKHTGIKCRFQAVRVMDYFPSEWHRTHKIPYVRMHLAAIKDGPRLHGLIEI